MLNILGFLNSACSPQLHEVSLAAITYDTDTRHDTDTDTWTPVKYIKLNPNTEVGVVLVSVSC